MTEAEYDGKVLVMTYQYSWLTNCFSCVRRFVIELNACQIQGLCFAHGFVTEYKDRYAEGLDDYESGEDEEFVKSKILVKDMRKPWPFAHIATETELLDHIGWDVFKICQDYVQERIDKKGCVSAPNMGRTWDRLYSFDINYNLVPNWVKA